MEENNIFYRIAVFDDGWLSGEEHRRMSVGSRRAERRLRQRANSPSLVAGSGRVRFRRRVCKLSRSRGIATLPLLDLSKVRRDARRHGYFGKGPDGETP